MKSILLAGNQYIPSIAYFAHWLQHGTLYLEAFEHYQKRSWRNRTWIQGRQNPVVLSIPLKQGKNTACPIREVSIAYDEPWPHLHLQSMKAIYGKTPFFEEIFPAIDEILHRKTPSLWELNLHFLHAITSMMERIGDCRFTTTYQKTYSETFTDLRKGIACGRIEENMVAGCPSYTQIQRIGLPFQANLSILDVLFHLGPETIPYLHRYRHFLYPSV